MISLAVLLSITIADSLMFSGQSLPVHQICCMPPDIEEEHPHPIIKPPSAKYMFEVEPEDLFEEDYWVWDEALNRARKYDPLIDESYLQL